MAYESTIEHKASHTQTKEDLVNRREEKLDPHGLPLIPQPSEFKDDPLNFPTWLKYTMLFQVGFMALLGPFNSAVPNPSFNLLSAAFDEPVAEVAYSTTVAIIMGGVAPFIWVALSDVYGRRYICLATQLVTIVSHIGTAYTVSFPALLGCRALNGIGFGGMMAMGTPVVNDLFFMHERGTVTGIYTVFVTNGAHLAVTFGGYLDAGWQWDFYLPALVTSLSFLVAFALLPESMFSRDPAFLEQKGLSSQPTRTYRQLLFDIRGNMIPQRRLHIYDFVSALRMLRYPSVSLTSWFYLWSWTFINILPALSMASTYATIYGFKSGPIGLCTGIPLLIGSAIGELSAGKLSDIIMYRTARKDSNGNKTFTPEHRLYLTCMSAWLGPVGMVVYGVCVQKRYSYLIPLIGLGIGATGLQISSTCLYAYVADCYLPQTPETAVLMNLARGLSFVVGFFWPDMVANIGYAWTWSTLAIVLLVFWLPILALMIWGKRWRERLGSPSFHQYI